VSLLLDNNKISEYSFVKEGMNSLGYESLNEVFFDVYEIKFKNLELVKEKKGDFNGNPIIEVDLTIKDQIFKNVRFVLTKENKIKINPNLLDYTKVVIFEKQNKIVAPQILEKTETPAPLVVKHKKVTKKPLIKEQNLIERTKAEFFDSIRGEVLEELKREVKAGIISDLIKESLQSNFDEVITDSGSRNKLQKIIENFNNSFRKEYIDLAEKVSRREALRYVESGGGTNATQYANGGIMNGDLTVNGNFQSTGMSVGNINVNELSVNALSSNSVLVYDTLSAGNSIYSNYGEFYDLDVNHDLTVTNNIVGHTATLSTLNLTSLTATNTKITDTLTTSSFTADYATVNNDLSVLGHLYADQAAITNNLTIGGGVSSYNGSYILGDVIVTGNLTVSQEIFGDIVGGNTIVNSSGDTLLAKAVKNISGSNFVNGNYTVQHNLSSYDLLLILYYVNPNGTREVVHASMINDTLSTTQISFANQPAPTDSFKLIIMS
jgi:hypothetical protein